MLFTYRLRFLLLLVLAGVFLAGCGGGGGGGGGTTAGSAAVEPEVEELPCPYGVEEGVTITYVDDNWRTRTTVTPQYNEHMQVVEVETITEEDSDADGVADSRQVKVESYEHINIAPVDDSGFIIFLDTFTLKDITESTFAGTLVHATVEDYVVDNLGVASAYASQRQEYTYSYTAAGLPMLRLYETWRHDATTGNLWQHSVDSTRYSYNAAGDVTRYVSQQTEDDNGDGVNDSLASLTKTYTFDAAGNLAYYGAESVDDRDGEAPLAAEVELEEIFYDHTYEDGVLVASVVTPPSDPSYFISYHYNPSGLLSTKVLSSNAIDITPDVDTLITLNYEYDASERIIHAEKITRIDSNEDGLADVTTVADSNWAYNSEGLLVSHDEETTRDEAATEGLQQHTANFVEYAYTNGVLTHQGNRFLADLNLDREFECLCQESLSDYFYDNGYLNRVDSLITFGGIDITSGTGVYRSDTRHHVVGFDYENDLLVSFDSEIATVEIVDPDPYYDTWGGVPVEFYSATFSYDTNSRLIALTTNTTFEGGPDYFVAKAQAFTIDYADSGFVDVSSRLSVDDVEKSSTDFSLYFGENSFPAGMNEVSFDYPLFLPYVLYPVVGDFYADDVVREKRDVNLTVLMPKMMCLLDVARAEDEATTTSDSIWSGAELTVNRSIENSGTLSVLTGIF